MNIAVESDVQIMRKHFSQFTATVDDDTKADIIENLEYYVHQYDNAVDFVHMEGFKMIIIPSLNSTNPNLRKQSCFLMGGALKAIQRFKLLLLKLDLLIS